MNLYLLTQTIHQDYDTFDSAVVCANSEEEARYIHPQSNVSEEWYKDWWLIDSWCDPKDVKITLIGIANRNTPKGVICASFNAG